MTVTPQPTATRARRGLCLPPAPRAPPAPQPSRPGRVSTVPHVTSRPFACRLGSGHPFPAPGCRYPVSGCLLSPLRDQPKAPTLLAGWAKGELLPRPRAGGTLCQHFPSPLGSLTPSHHLPTGDGRRVLSLFHQKGLQDFDTLLLSDDGGTLYVGVREAILALNIQDPGIPRLKNMVRRPGRKGMGCG